MDIEINKNMNNEVACSIDNNNLSCNSQSKLRKKIISLIISKRESVVEEKPIIIVGLCPSKTKINQSTRIRRPKSIQKIVSNTVLDIPDNDEIKDITKLKGPFTLSLMLKGTRKNLEQIPKIETNNEIFLKAIKRGNIEIIKELLKTTPELIQYTDKVIFYIKIRIKIQHCIWHVELITWK